MAARALVAAFLLAMASPAVAEDQVEVRTRSDAVGDVYRFRSDSRYAEASAGGKASQSNSQVFEIEVLGVAPEGLRLRYTLKEATLSDTSGPAMATAMKALIGVPLEFRVRSDGMLSALDNWADYKARVLAAVDASLPAGDPIRNTYHQRFGQEPINAAEDMVLADVRLMAVMEPRGPVILGMSDVVDNRRRPPGRALSTVSVTKPGCELRLVRASASRTPGVVQDLTTEATVSVRDGRILSLTQRRADRAGGESSEEQVTIRRISAAPGC
ncbi:hypothetical protein [Phenylobacterium sp.]|uniref:hypothetical protein n=1 Tax=Phenylobacterium sp. TaxID=1871053 RepID=UPI002ED8006D